MSAAAAGGGGRETRAERRRRGIGAFAPLLLALPCGACLQGDYHRERVHQALAAGEVDAIRPGTSELKEVLERLGAPLHVSELDDGFALSWGWLDETYWNLEAQVPVTDAAGFQLQYGDTQQRIYGVLVVVDADLVVRVVERGYLADMLRRRARPHAMDAHPEAEPRDGKEREPAPGGSRGA